MRQEAKEYKTFIEAIAKDPRNMATRLVFADWLDDHDEPEEADAQRQFSVEKYDAEMWLRQFCLQHDAKYETLIKIVSKPYGEYCFGTDYGPEAARNDYFWEAVEIVLGKLFNEEHRESMGFRCAC